MDESPAPDFSTAAQQPTRRHGLELPLNPYQIGSWVLFLFECSVLYVIFLPPLSFVLKLVSGIVITVLMLFAFYNAFKAMTVDPTDPKVREEQQARLRGEDYQTELRHFCLICNAHVQPRTKHCGQCNRCVDTFDHHCIWLNNCVGEQNYRYFMKAVVCLLVSTTVKLGFGIYIVINYHTFIDDFNKYASEFYGTDGEFAALHHITVASCVINVFLWLLLMKLFTLHIWLHYKGLTTYESIMLAREEKEELAAMKQRRPKKQKKSKTIKHLDEESYIGNSTFSGKSAFQTATTGLHIDLEDSGQERSRSSRKRKSKGKKKQAEDKKEVSVATFPRTEGKELENKNLEILGRSESNFKNQDRSRIDKEDSSISVAMLNAEPSSFISSAREYKFQESVLEGEEEKNDIEVLKEPGLNDTPPKKLEKQEREERSQSTGRKEVNRSVHTSQNQNRGSPEVSRSVNKSQSKGLFASKSKINRVFSSDAEGSFGINRSGSHHVDANPDITDLKTVVLPVKNYKKIDVYSNDRSDSSWSPLTAINASGIQAIHAQMQKDNTEYLKQVSYNTVTGNPVLTQTTLSKMETNVRPESPDAKELAAKMNSVRSSAINLDDPEAGTQSFQSNANQTRKSVSF